MNKILLLLVSLSCILWEAKAEELKLNPSDANVFGHVVDKQSGEHLPYINIFLRGTTIGTVTDATGHYAMTNLPEGTFTIVMMAWWYQLIGMKRPAAWLPRW